MTKKERVVAALQHKETDIIPFHCDFTSQAAQRFAVYTNTAPVYSAPGSHLKGCTFPTWEEEVPGRPGYVRDAMGVVWNRNGVDKTLA